MNQTVRRSPRCCKSDDFGDLPLRKTRGKVPREYEDEPEDRPDDWIGVRPGWGDAGHLVLDLLFIVSFPGYLRRRGFS
jgi:hypothetical protein